MDIGRRHWGIALPAAALVHTSVLAAILLPDTRSSAENAGVGGIEVSFSIAGGLPGLAAPANAGAILDAVQSAEQTGGTQAIVDAKNVPKPDLVAMTSITDAVAPEVEQTDTVNDHTDVDLTAPPETQATTPASAKAIVPQDMSPPPIEDAKLRTDPRAAEMAETPSKLTETTDVPAAKAIVSPQSVSAEIVDAVDTQSVAVVNAVPARPPAPQRRATANAVTPVTDVEPTEVTEAVTDLAPVKLALLPPEIAEAPDTPTEAKLQIDTAQSTVAETLSPPAHSRPKSQPSTPVKVAATDATDAPAKSIEPVQVPKPLDAASQGQSEAAPVSATVEASTGMDGTQMAAIDPSAIGTGGAGGAAESAQTGNAEATQAGGNPGANADYMLSLQAWLERHKKYPRRAQKRRQEGQAYLYFVVARDGRVLDYRLEKSSGHAALDGAVIDMIKLAQPLPKIPDSLPQAQLEVVVPVEFFLN